MKIQYDHQIFTSQKYGGISRYFYELIKGFNALGDIKIGISLLLSNNYYISKKRYTKHIDLLSQKKFRGKNRLFNLVNKPYTIQKLKKQNFDIFHPTYYNTYFLKYIGDKPFVLTVYDMIHEKFPDMFSVNDKTSKNKKLLVEKATKVLVISESTKKDLIEIFGTDESKIEVVYLGNSMFPELKVDAKLKIPNRYILFVGSRVGYKNFERFIKSIASILNKDKSLCVICAGGDKFNFKEFEIFSNLNITNQITQYNLNDSTLANFYQNAQLFVFPSLCEGFGIPVLESFACQCPLLCSNTSSLPEIAGDGAYYFDPYSEESIRNAIIKVLENKYLQDELRQKGVVRLKQFSWKKAVVETKYIYESIMK